MAIKWNAKITEDRVVEAVKEEMFGLGSTGFCLACGDERDGCEPDARDYECYNCGEMEVWGASELLQMMDVELRFNQRKVG